jgi:hypothetical protein
MAKVLQSIINIGTQAKYDEGFQKRIRITNICNALACIIYLLIGCTYFLFKDYTTSIFIALLAFINLLAFYLQKQYWHTLSLSLFLVSGYLSVFYFDSYAGLKSGAFLYYPAIIISLFYLFDTRKEKSFISLHAITIIGLILIHQFTHRTLFSSPIVTAELQSKLLIANILLSALSIIYFVALGFKKIRP